MTEEENSSKSDASTQYEALIRVLKEKLEIKDRKWRTKTYKQCFLHSQAIGVVMEQNSVSEATAVSALNELRSNGYIQHVVDPHKEFVVGQKSKTLYFCFLETESSHSKQVTAKYLEQNKLNETDLADILKGSDEWERMETKMKRMEETLTRIEASEHATETKLEIVHQATISLIQALVVTAALFMVLWGYTLCVILPSLHQSHLAVLITSLVGLGLIGAFMAYSFSLLSVWLQLDACVVQAAEGEDAIMDDDSRNSKISTTETRRVVPLRSSLARNPSAFLKQSLIAKPKLMHASNKDKKIVQRGPADLPRPTQWPHRPILVCTNTPVDSSLKAIGYGDGPCPIGKPFTFSSDLFEGQCLIRLRDIPNSDSPADDEAYFSGRRRLFRTIVQGRFKEPLKVSEVLTGHEFTKPLKNLPHPWILKAAQKFIGKLSPGADIRILGDQPNMLAGLAATAQVVRGDEPGNEPDIASSDDLQEDCSLFGGSFSADKVSSKKRKLHLANPTRAAQYTYDTDTVYTFDFYQSLLNCKTYSLDLGVTNIGMASVLNGQPIQALCKTTDGRYLWSFQIWHEKLLPDPDKSRVPKYGAIS